MIQRAAAGYVEAFTADADDLAIRHTPFLTRPSVASNDDDLRSLGGRASLHVQAAAAGPGDQTVVKLLDNRRGLGCDSPLNDPKPSIRVGPKCSEKSISFQALFRALELNKKIFVAA
jgi:hypothetical protein